jgi:predicted DNA-binding protein
MAIPDVSAMTPDELIDWVANNDLSELVATATPAVDLPSGPPPAELPTVYSVRLPERMRVALDGTADELGVTTAALIRQIIDQWLVARDNPQRMVDAEAVIAAVNSLRSAA